MIETLRPIEPIDYLVIGHITQDKVPGGFTPGGTASYAALTAKALGRRVGILTSYANQAVLPQLDGIQVINQPAESSTVFENIYHPTGRVQTIHSQAERLHPRQLPQSWLNTPLVHLGPVAAEIDPAFFRLFPSSFLGVTPQGWYRQWDAVGRVSFLEWIEANHYLRNANAIVLSIEDVDGNEDIIADLVYAVRVLVVTEGYRGAQVYWNGDVRNFRPPQIEEVDATGAGDIFATAFFIRLQQTQDPWEAARFATLIASRSISRKGLESVPTEAEIRNDMIDIITKR